MKALDKETAIARMNTFGRNGTPFLFVIDYMQEHSYVEPLDGIDTSVCLYQFRGTGNAPDAGARYAGTIDWEFTPPAPAFTRPVQALAERPVRLLLARNLRPHGRGQDKILPDERHD